MIWGFSRCKRPSQDGKEHRPWPRRCIAVLHGDISRRFNGSLNVQAMSLPPGCGSFPRCFEVDRSRAMKG